MIVYGWVLEQKPAKGDAVLSYMFVSELGFISVSVRTPTTVRRLHTKGTIEDGLKAARKETDYLERNGWTLAGGLVGFEADPKDVKAAFTLRNGAQWIPGACANIVLAYIATRAYSGTI